MSEIVVEKREGYAVLTLNRPDKRNAITGNMAKELKQSLIDLKQEVEIKFLVVTGAGDQAFCAGGDLNELHGDMTAGQAYQLLVPMKEVLLELLTFPVPTIAVLNGQARGGGCEIATACDFRYGVKAASYGFVQGNLGITPGWGGGTLLYQKVERAFAAHWLMDAEMYPSAEAYRIGWLHKVISGDEDEGRLFSSFLNKTQQQLKIFKRQYLEHIDVLHVKERMDREVKQCAQLWETEEHKSAVRKFVEKRKR
ncbi:enoyl-CoA hydratase/isomerase family protein [Halobacillus litoralis]|uniref:enoyl-CoA hydratase/isomerase family protein n=1 Tax=Halobacillus litoralis TaxID=45668 RepID=UPI001CFE154A|nr:enoyl-CoA hydratase/isomerase family protein [Halobacillus litoralis]